MLASFECFYFWIYYVCGRNTAVGGNQIPRLGVHREKVNQLSLIFQVLKRGYEDRLIIEDTSYDHQGEYVCEAVNMIGGIRKAVQSEPIVLEVRGNSSIFKITLSFPGNDVTSQIPVFGGNQI